MQVRVRAHRTGRGAGSGAGRRGHPEVTYLGAHVVPPEFAGDPAGYVDLVCGPMLAACAPHARWIDVFCETGAFGAEAAAAILAAGREAGLGARIHANQLGPGPGVQVAAEAGAASADHCTYLTDDDVDALVSARVVATLLPGAEFGTRHPYPDARRLLDAGVTVALATDCNPGSSYTCSMPFCIALAVRDMGMTTQEAVWSATAGGARALRRPDVGHLGVGARADLILLDAPSHVYLAYRPGVPQIAAVWQAGRLVTGSIPYGFFWRHLPTRPLDLNEKGIVEKAGLSEAAQLLPDLGSTTPELLSSVEALQSCLNG